MVFLPSNIGLSGSNFPIIQFYEDGMISTVTKMLGILMGETIYQPGWMWYFMEDTTNEYQSYNGWVCLKLGKFNLWEWKTNHLVMRKNTIN